MKNLYSILLLFLILSETVLGQDISFTAEAPSVVEVGEQFRLTYTLNARPSSFKAPEIKDFYVLSGPNQSTSTSFQIINGKSSQSITITYTYYLVANNPGKFTIEPSVAVVDRKEYQSNALTIEVVGEKQPSQTAPQQEQPSSQQPVPEEELFVKVLPDKSSVYLGEHVIVTLKIFTRLSITGFGSNEMPDFAGFWTKDIESPTQINLERENVGGKIYNTGIIRKVILFPQKTGKIIIEPFKLETYIRQQINTPRSIFDDFFGPSYTQVSKMLESKPVTIDVKPLPPGQPDAFAGAVGSLSFESSVDKTDVKTNDAVTLKIRVKGNGNLNLVSPPKIDFPPDFDTFDPKVTANINNNGTGQTGSKTFEYLLIPRHAGSYRIPPVKFAYFDLIKKQYQILATNEFRINVARGEETETTPVVTGFSKEDIKVLGSDILFIKAAPFKLHQVGKVLFGSFTFYIIYIGSFLVFIVIVIAGRAHIKRQQNIELLKNKKANKVARKRLKLAAGYLKQNEKEAFYESVLKAFWGYLSDKLNIPVSELSRDTAIKNLSGYIEDPNLIDEFMGVIDTCEMARYSPSGGMEEMDKLYSDAIRLISKLEQNLRG